MNYVLTDNELRQRQALDLDSKIKFSIRRISSFLEEYDSDHVYISYSGGLDSTVMRDLVHKVDPSIPSVYLDTWMEDPRIRRYVKQTDNLIRLRPEMSLKEIISTYGWCFPSKDVAEAIYYARLGKQWANNKLRGLDRNGNESRYRQQYKKYLPLVEWDILISPFCCDKQKEEVIMKFEKEKDMHPFIGTRAEESSRRKEAYLRTGCNTLSKSYILDAKSGKKKEKVNRRPCSRPLSIWLEQDIYQYAVREKLHIPEPYGDIYRVGTCPGQMSFFEGYGKLTCSGNKRTGCIFCPVHCHLDNFAKFKNIKSYNKKLYDYCMDELGERKLLEMIRKQFGGNYEI